MFCSWINIFVVLLFLVWKLQLPVWHLFINSWICFSKKKHTAKTIKRAWFDGTNERLSQTIVIIFSQLSFLKKNNRPIFSWLKSSSVEGYSFQCDIFSSIAGNVFQKKTHFKNHTELSLMVQIGDWLSFHIFSNMVPSNRFFRIEQELLCWKNKFF